VKRKIEIAPTLACADYLNLGTDIITLEKYGADRIHFDIMDGLAVPNYCLNWDILSRVNDVCALPVDVHLMTTFLERDIDNAIRNNANSVAFHVEQTGFDTIALLERIKRGGVQCALAINPQTELESLIPYLDMLDYVLLMAVKPGFSGQRLLENTYSRIDWLKRIRAEKELGFSIYLDGGISYDNALHCVESGADILVAGKLCIFSSRDSLQNGLEKFRAVVGGDDLS
jgi:Pentose-5-phosphate-3-epimerase